MIATRLNLVLVGLALLLFTTGCAATGEPAAPGKTPTKTQVSNPMLGKWQAFEYGGQPIPKDRDQYTALEINANGDWIEGGSAIYTWTQRPDGRVEIQMGSIRILRRITVKGDELVYDWNGDGKVITRYRRVK